MSEKINITIYGIKDEPPATSGCSCGPAGCGPTLTMGELFEDLKTFIKESSFSDKVEVIFSDIIEDDLDEDTTELLKKQFPIPYTRINEKLSFYGGIPKEAILNELAKL